MAVATIESTMDCVREGLYIGDLSASLNGPLLMKAGVSHVVDLANTVQLRLEGIAREVNLGDAACDWSESCPSVQARLFVQLDDIEDASLDSIFKPINDFIGRAHAGGGCVLVHCVRGKSRSFAAVAQYLMHTGSSLLEALQSVKAVRPSVRLNPGFQKQLMILEETLRPDLKPSVRLKTASRRPVLTTERPDYGSARKNSTGDINSGKNSFHNSSGGGCLVTSESTLEELRVEAKRRGLQFKGTKRQLLDRLGLVTQLDTGNKIIKVDSIEDSSTAGSSVLSSTSESLDVERFQDGRSHDSCPESTQNHNPVDLEAWIPIGRGKTEAAVHIPHRAAQTNEGRVSTLRSRTDSDPSRRSSKSKDADTDDDEESDDDSDGSGTQDNDIHDDDCSHGDGALHISQEVPSAPTGAGCSSAPLRPHEHSTRAAQKKASGRRRVRKGEAARCAMEELLTANFLGNFVAPLRALGVCTVAELPGCTDAFLTGVLGMRPRSLAHFRRALESVGVFGLYEADDGFRGTFEQVLAHEKKVAAELAAATATHAGPEAAMASPAAAAVAAANAERSSKLQGVGELRGARGAKGLALALLVVATAALCARASFSSFTDRRKPAPRLPPHCSTARPLHSPRQEFQPTARGSRTYDLTVLGAEGPLGTLVARHVAANLPPGLKWALAGRDRRALESLRAELGVSVGLLVMANATDDDRSDARDGVGGAGGDGGGGGHDDGGSGDAARGGGGADLSSVVGASAAVVSCADPGLRLAAAAHCAALGVHYADLGFGDDLRAMARIVDRLGPAAAASGAKIVLEAGSWSTPFDLGALVVAEALAARGLGASRITALVREARRPYTRHATGALLASALRPFRALVSALLHDGDGDGEDEDPYLLLRDDVLSTIPTLAAESALDEPVVAAIAGSRSAAAARAAPVNGTCRADVHANGWGNSFKVDPDFGAVAAPHSPATTTARIVRRSLALLGRRDCRYGEGIAISALADGLAFSLASSLPPYAVRIARAFEDAASFMFFQPSRPAVAATHAQASGANFWDQKAGGVIDFVASSESCPDGGGDGDAGGTGCPSGALFPQARARLRFAGDPWSDTSAKLLAEVGLCLAAPACHGLADGSAGVTTPAAAMGVGLIRRLEAADAGEFMQLFVLE